MVVWSLSAAAPSSAAAYGAAEVVLDSAFGKAQGTGAQAQAGTWCWEGRPGEDFGRPGTVGRGEQLTICSLIELSCPFSLVGEAGYG